MRDRVDRWELLALVTHLRKELGLADRDVMVLRAHLSVLPHGPLDPGGLNVSFMNVTEILGRACGMDERRFRRGESRLEEVGLIRRNLSGNGRRFPERDGTGRIVAAYGIDLAPLLARRFELAAHAETLAEKQRVLRQRKNNLSARLSTALRGLLDGQTPLPQWVDDLRDTLRKVVRRKNPALVELSKIENDIARLESLLPHDDTPEDANQAPLCNQVVPDKSTADDGQTVRHIESKPKEINKPSKEKMNIPKLGARWSETSVLQDLYPDPPKTGQDAIRLLFDFSSYMNLDKEIVGQALSRLGWENTFLVLDYLAEKLATLGHPARYLRSIITGYDRGETVAGGRVTKAA